MCSVWIANITRSHFASAHPISFSRNFSCVFRACIYVGSKYNTEILVAFREFWWSKTTLDYSIFSRESRKNLHLWLLVPINHYQIMESFSEVWTAWMSNSEVCGYFGSLEKAERTPSFRKVPLTKQKSSRSVVASFVSFCSKPRTTWVTC